MDLKQAVEQLTKKDGLLVENLMKALSTPKDLAGMDNDHKASIITLYFIGYVAKPTGISKELLEKCCEAFNNNRGKVEREIEAVLKVLNEA